MSESAEEYLTLGVDPSLNSTGICLLDKGGTIYHCEAIHPSPLGGSDRLYYIYSNLISILESFKPKVISFEKQISAQRYNWNAKNILDLAENIGVLKLAIKRYCLYYPETVVVAFTAPELKKYATGNSKATKEEVMETIGVRAMNRMKGSVIDWAVNDIADAYYAARYGLEVYKNKTYEEHLSS